MKIRRIQIEGCEAFICDIDLDFCDDSGIPYDNIILVGENGAGKSTILELTKFMLENGLTGKKYYKKDFNQIMIETIYEQDDIEYFNKVGGINFIDNILKIKGVISQDDKNAKIKVLKSDLKEVQMLYFREYFYEKTKAVFSDVEINYETKEISNVTALEIDNHKNQNKNMSLGTEIKQLFIDLYFQDAGDHMKLSKSGGDVNKFEGRLSRFENAFNQFFGGNLIFYGIEAENGYHNVIFKKGNKSVKIDDLSSGEKQIIYRGAFLLKDLNVISGGVVLIDEPEISMHPIWQLKIYDYYKNLFIDSSGKQLCQLIVATHSPYVLQGYDFSKGTLFILPDGKKITSLPKTIKNTTTIPMINYLAFNIPSVELHNEIFGYLGDKNNLENMGDFDKFFSTDPNFPISEKWRRQIIGSPPKEETHTLHVYIRNSIHHPENTLNDEYTPQQLKDSIDGMIKLI